MGTDAVCATAPSKKTARSLECAPMSSRQTPSSRSSAESVASAAAMDSSTASETSSPARLAQVTVLCSALPEQVAMCRSTSSRAPTMPTGSKMPGCSSRMNWRGSRCRISRSGGRSTARARSTAVRTSSRVISRMRLPSSNPPLVLSPRICGPPTPTTHSAMLARATRSACSLAALHRFGRRSKLGDQPFAHPGRLHHAVTAIAQRALVQVGRQHARPRAADVQHHDQVVLLLAHRAHCPSASRGWAGWGAGLRLLPLSAARWAARFLLPLAALSLTGWLLAVFTGGLRSFAAVSLVALTAGSAGALAPAICSLAESPATCPLRAASPAGGLTPTLAGCSLRRHRRFHGACAAGHLQHHLLVVAQSPPPPASDTADATRRCAPCSAGSARGTGPRQSEPECRSPCSGMKTRASSGSVRSISEICSERCWPFASSSARRRA